MVILCRDHYHQTLIVNHDLMVQDKSGIFSTYGESYEILSGA